MLKIIYDFDGTLSNSELPLYSFLSKCNIPLNNREIMKLILNYAKENNTDIYHAYFSIILEAIKTNNLSFDDNTVCEGAMDVKYQPGVLKYFKAFEDKIENYIVTSGYQNYIYHTKINPYIKTVYGSSVDYKPNGDILIKEIVTDEVKIKKIDLIAGIDFDNVIYIGDGLTDIPAFKYVNEKGGISILVNNSSKVYKEILDKGINVYYFKPDYKEGSTLYNFIKDMILFEKCLKFVKNKHNNQKRNQGTSYYTHPLSTAKILRDSGYDVNYQIAGLCHDLLTLTNATEEEILSLAGNNVLEVCKIKKEKKGLSPEEYYKKVNENQFAKIVLIAERIHNLSEAEFNSHLWQKKYLKDTESNFVNLAKDTNLKDLLDKEITKVKNNLIK